MSRIGSGIAGAGTGAGIGSAFGPIGSGIGAGAGFLLGLFGGSDGNTKPQYTVNNGDTFDLDPSKGLINKDGSKYAGLKNRVPTDWYLSQLQNQYNIAQQWKMMEYQTAIARENWNMENAYNTPQAQAARLLAAGINPTLAMAGDGSIGQAGNIGGASQGVNGSVSGSPSLAGLPSARATEYASDQSLIGSGLETMRQAFIDAAQKRNVDAESNLKEIDAQTRLVENLAKVRELRARANSEEEKAQYTRLEKEILDASAQSIVSRNQSEAAKSYNDTLLQQDERQINVYRKQIEYYSYKIQEANFNWLPKEKAATVAKTYAEAKYYGASASEAIKRAELVAEQIKGEKLTNDQRKDLDKEFRSATRSQYQAVKVGLEQAKQNLEQARYANDHKAITYWNQQVNVLSNTLKNLAVGFSAVTGGISNIPQTATAIAGFAGY